MVLKKQVMNHQSIIPRKTSNNMLLASIFRVICPVCDVSRNEVDIITSKSEACYYVFVAII
jgi:hypothetical protein